jgi:hypothetical protein
MQFEPKSERELKAAPFAKGIYPFTVIAACEKKSSQGNAMLVLKLMVTDGGDGRIVVTDYLLAKRPLKLRNAAFSCGLEAEYLSGKLTEDDFVERSGRLRLAVKKDPDGTYADRNVVADYVVAETGEATVPSIVQSLRPRQLTLEDALARFSSRESEARDRPTQPPR